VAQRRQEQESSHLKSVEGESLLVLQERNKALTNDLKYFKQTCEDLATKVEQLREDKAHWDANQVQTQGELQAFKDKLEESHRECRAVKLQLKDKETTIQQQKLELLEREAQFVEGIKKMASD
jgi:FtsZ-binding cell division protein ZapB